MIPVWVSPAIKGVVAAFKFWKRKKQEMAPKIESRAEDLEFVPGPDVKFLYGHFPEREGDYYVKFPTGEFATIRLLREEGQWIYRYDTGGVFWVLSVEDIKGIEWLERLTIEI